MSDAQEFLCGGGLFGELNVSRHSVEQGYTCKAAYIHSHVEPRST